MGGSRIIFSLFTIWHGWSGKSPFRGRPGQHVSFSLEYQAQIYGAAGPTVHIDATYLH